MIIINQRKTKETLWIFVKSNPQMFTIYFGLHCNTTSASFGFSVHQLSKLWLLPPTKVVLEQPHHKHMDPKQQEVRI